MGLPYLINTKRNYPDNQNLHNAQLNIMTMSNIGVVNRQKELR